MLLRSLLIVACFLSLSSVAVAQNEVIGQTPNEIVEYIRDTTGEPRVVMLFASWCPSCRLKMPDMIEIGEEYPDSIIVVAVDEDEDALERYVETLDDFSFPMFLNEDEEWKLAKAMKNRLLVETWDAIPYMIFFDEHNRIVEQGNLSVRDVVEFLGE